MSLQGFKAILYDFLKMEDEEKSTEVLTKFKQSLEYNLYHQQKKNDGLQKDITR